MNRQSPLLFGAIAAMVGAAAGLVTQPLARWIDDLSGNRSVLGSMLFAIIGGD